MYKYKRNGFTLVELMAVIIIISLIALLTFPNIINQIKKTKKSNNKMIEDVVIEQAKKYVSDNKDELLEDEYCMPISTLIDNDYIKEDIVNINDIKDNKVVHITLDNNNSYEVLDKNKCFLSAVKYLLNKTNPITVTNYTDGDIHEMYTFEHEATEQTPALTDYRYIGSDPNNYVEFNNELWRIIGIFETDDGTGNYEKRVKIIRNEKLSSNMKWDLNKSNEWPTATLNIYLNGEYYDGLDEMGKSMISNAKYYLGGTHTYIENAETYYNFERGMTVYNGRSTSWNGKISLMYPSDNFYTYSLGVDDACYNDASKCSSTKGGTPSDGWIYNPSVKFTQWLLLPDSGNGYGAFVLYTNGALDGYVVLESFGVRPTLYLSSSVKITSGDGTKDNAYKLSM